MADSVCQPGSFRVPNALEREWHQFEGPVTIEAFDLDCDGEIDLLLREDTLQPPRKEELRSGYRWILGTNRAFSRNIFKPLNVARQQTLAQVLRGPIQQSSEEVGFAPFILAAGIAALVVAPEVTLPVIVGGLLALSPLGCSTEEIACLSGEVDCEAIEKACANKGTATITTLPRKKYSSWYDEGHFVEESMLMLSKRSWYPEKKAFASFLLEEERNKAHVLIEPIDYPQEEPSVYDFDFPLEPKWTAFSTVMDPSGNLFAQGLEKIFRIDLSQEKPVVEVVILENAWLQHTDAGYQKLLLDRKNVSLQSIVYLGNEFRNPYTWVFWDGAHSPISLRDLDSVQAAFQEDPKTIWVFGHEVYQGSKIYRLRRVQVREGSDVSQELHTDVLEALNNFYGFESTEADIQFLGIDPVNQKLFFKVQPKETDDVTNLDSLHAGILSIDSKTLEVQELATPRNFLDAFGLPCDPEKLIEMAMEDPEEARMYLNKMEYLEELIPIDENNLVGDAGGTHIQMQLP